ncbi:hypothetical protein NE237_006302 [Protea cynaroides]|uniref:Uncharacterized protein n=1 Tax=Protea cynaroides TaxID=273540 RepID=A0A9Q0KLZ9_9MAGN|nr:hypothetical protein NE237_006302 [Protea cynaroides]
MIDAKSCSKLDASKGNGVLNFVEEGDEGEDLWLGTSKSWIKKQKTGAGNTSEAKKANDDALSSSDLLYGWKMNLLRKSMMCAMRVKLQFPMQILLEDDLYFVA